MSAPAHDPYHRPAYEYRIALCWLLAAAPCLLGWWRLPGAAAMLLPAVGGLLLAARYLHAGLGLLGRGSAGAMLSFITLAKLKKLSGLAKPGRKPAFLWFGWGFDWTPEHTQRAMDTMMAGTATRDKDQDLPGSPWIHGLNQGREAPVHFPLKSLEGHTLIFGTTGAGKTRAYELMVAQAIHRGDVVFMVDPKGDAELRARMEKECRRAGRADAFVFFHPAFPSTSVRIDPLRNFTRTTELASRISALLPQDGNAATFTAFCFRVLNLVAQGLVGIGEKPTLKSLRFYIEGGPDRLLVRWIEAHLNRVIPDWRDQAEPYFTQAHEGKLEKMDTITSAGDLAVIHYYRRQVARTMEEDEGINGLLSLVEHNRVHYGKMIAALIPIMNMLTSGTLGGLLSPDPADTRDDREIYDTAKMIAGGCVVYLGLDSLSDALVAQAIGSILLADLASVAGAIYNSGQPARPITMFVDEAAEVVNGPFIQILNKGRGAGFQVTMATQTLPDLVARTGDEARARQILGNCNNLICLRIKDGETQEFVVETFGTTFVRTIQQTIGASQSSAHNVAHFSGTAGQSLTWGEQDLFPKHLLGQLPNFHYIAAIAGGRVIKGRLPILKD